MAKNPLVGTPITDSKREHDLVLWECEPRYCREAVDVPAGTYEIGQVITNETVSASYSHGHRPAFSDVICLANITVPDGGSRAIPVFVRGPALLNFDEIKRASDNESDADLRTRLADLIAQGVKFVREPGIQSTPDLSA